MTAIGDPTGEIAEKEVQDASHGKSILLSKKLCVSCLQ